MQENNTQQTWYEAWKPQKEQVVTPENYTPKEEFQAILDSLKPFKAEPRVSFELEPDTMAHIAHRKREGHYYARQGNPAGDELEKRIIQLEVNHAPEHFDAVVYPSGMAAISNTIDSLYLLSKEERSKGKRNVFVLVEPVYTQTKIILKSLLPGDLEETIVVKAGEDSDVTDKIKEHGDKIIAVFFEPVKNPTLEYTNTREVAEVANEHNVPVVVDNTFLTPYLLQPSRMGADIVIHSTTKYIGGKGDLLGGIVIGPKEFINAETCGPRALRTEKGAVPSMRDLNLIIKRLPDLADNVESHCRNAREVAGFLRSNQYIGDVCYPNLREQTRDGYAGGVVTALLKGRDDEEKYARGRRLAEFFSNNPGPMHYEVSFGEKRTLVLPYDSVGYTKDQIIGVGYPVGLVRISIGREKDIGPTKEYLRKALNYACSPSTRERC